MTTGQVIQIVRPIQWFFWLDKVGNLDSLLEKNGKIKYDYDGLDRLFELNAFNSRMVKYLYDKVSNRKKMKVCKATDTTTIYLEQTYPSYDEGNRLLITIVSPDTFNFAYWDPGPIKEIEYPYDLKEQYWLTNRNFIDSMRTYNPATPPARPTVLFRFAYRYNALTDRDSMAIKITRPLTAPLTGTIRYSHDNLRRLRDSKSYFSGIESINYTYDPVGNRKTRIKGGTTTKCTYDIQNNRLMQTEDPILHTYHYDASGNITFMDSTSRSYRRYYWDYENRLVAAKTWAIEPGDSAYHVYCALGKRIAKFFWDNSASITDTTSYCYDGMFVICEFGGHDNLKNKYVYANGLLLEKIDSLGNKYFYHHDALGSTMGLTDVNKNVVQSYFYDDFGNLSGSWGTVANNYLYTGQEYDSSPLWLYNLRARYYATDIGRFISEDPEIGFIYMPQQRNLYPYVWNMPITFTDPLGLFTGCKVITKYPVKTENGLVSEEEKTHWWEFRRAYTTGFNQYLPIPFFWVHCEWSRMAEITRIYRELTIWSYVLKCWEECNPPVVKVYDVVILGPLSTEILRRLSEAEKVLGPYNIISESPAFKLKWEIICLEAGPP